MKCTITNSAKYVIIGNSTAAVGCVEGIRSIDKTGKIIMLSKENYPAYSRPLISYLLERRTTERNMMLRGDSFYKDNGIDFRCGVEAVSIDEAEKTVKCKDDSVFSYEKLMVATGSRPFVPPMEGLETVLYRTFLDLDSAKSLDAAISKQTRVLIIGAGLIGLKCAEGIADRVKNVTIVEMAPRCLPMNLDADGSCIIQRKMEEHNVHFVLGDSVKCFANGVALTKSGAEITFDVLVCAVGVRPNTHLVEKAGGKVDKGIVIDGDGKTSLHDVWAAGDCVLSYDISANENRILAVLPNAYMQGEAAGINMAGGSKPFTKAIPLNSAAFFGLHLVSAGSRIGTCIDASRPSVKAHGAIPAKRGEYRKFFVEDDLLKGFVIIGDVSRSGIYTSIIRDKIPLSSLDFDAIKEEPQLMAFSKSRREKILAAKEDAPDSNWNFATV